MPSNYEDTIFCAVSVIGILEIELLPSVHIMYTITSTVHYVGAMCMCVLVCIINGFVYKTL